MFPSRFGIVAALVALCHAARANKKSEASSDDCAQCLKSGGGFNCDSQCAGASLDCQSCVHWQGDTGCANGCGGGKDEESTRSTVSATYNASSINWYDNNAKVSTYFTVGEVTQWDSRRIPTSSTIQNDILALARELDKVRQAWGGSIGVTSWYRPPAVNSEVGGAPNSQHIYGRAADIYPGSGSTYDLQSWLDNGIWANRALGYGASCCGFVHIDTRAGRIRWDYR